MFIIITSSLHYYCTLLHWLLFRIITNSLLRIIINHYYLIVTSVLRSVLLYYYCIALDYIDYCYVVLQIHHFILLHHFCIILTSFLHHFYINNEIVIVTNGKSCNDDSHL